MTSLVDSQIPIKLFTSRFLYSGYSRTLEDFHVKPLNTRIEETYQSVNTEVLKSEITDFIKHWFELKIPAEFHVYVRTREQKLSNYYSGVREFGRFGTTYLTNTRIDIVNESDVEKIFSVPDSVTDYVGVYIRLYDHLTPEKLPADWEIKFINVKLQDGFKCPHCKMISLKRFDERHFDKVACRRNRISNGMESSGFETLIYYVPGVRVSLTSAQRNSAVENFGLTVTAKETIWVRPEFNEGVRKYLVAKEGSQGKKFPTFVKYMESLGFKTVLNTKLKAASQGTCACCSEFIDETFGSMNLMGMDYRFCRKHSEAVSVALDKILETVN